MVSPYTKVIFTVYDYAGKSAFCRNNQGPMILKSWTAEMFQLKVLNYLWKIPRGYHKFSSWIPMALAMVFFSCIVKKASKTFQLESTVPKKKKPELLGASRHAQNECALRTNNRRRNSVFFLQLSKWRRPLYDYSFQTLTCEQPPYYSITKAREFPSHYRQGCEKFSESARTKNTEEWSQHTRTSVKLANIAKGNTWSI